MRSARPAGMMPAPATWWSSRRIGPREIATVVFVVAAAACASTPSPALVAAAPPPPTFDQKMAAILHLEDRRTLTDASLPAEAGNLATLLTDSEGRLRRRAALAIGRAGLAEGIPPLTAALAKDREPEVRTMAALGLGLIGDPSASSALLPALGDPDPRVQGRAAQALGLIGHREAAGSIAGMAAAHVAAGVLAGVASDDETYPLGPRVEAVRLGVYALARLEALDELRAVVIGPDGLPVSNWWPLAYAMQRIAKPAAAPTLRTWLTRGGPTTRAFAARGLGVLKDAESRAALEALAKDEQQAPGVRVQALRALGAIGDSASAPVLAALIDKASPRMLRIEAVTALGAVAEPADADVLLDYLEHEWTPMRSAAQAALAKADPETFMRVLSGLDVDEEWGVRASLATTLGAVGREVAAPRLSQLVVDDDPKVRAAALTALAALGVPGIDKHLLSGLEHEALGVRLAAARALGTAKPAGAADALQRAYERSAADTTYVVRAAILAALVQVDPAVATPLLRAALGDKDWAIRVRAAALLRELDPAAAATPERPAPPPVEPALDETAAMVAPAFSPQAYLQTTRGEIRIELAVLDAPRTVANFIALAGRGYFDGLAWHRVVPDFVAQTGDPRGDGEGGPGYAIRDELNERQYVRGTVGMALDWADTGGSQFFITHSPQPHLDTRYTVFGHVVAGMDVVDRLEAWDRVESVRVWDGARWIGGTR